MTAVAVPSLRYPEVLQWLAPCPLWDESPATSDPAGPWIAELASDNFVDDFTAMLAGDTPAQLADMAPARRRGTGDDAPYRLFHPLNQRYYLVSATLVCRRPGIPDHTVQANRQERTTFVIRRLTDTGAEEAFLAATQTWVATSGATLVEGEEQHPMHPAPAAPFAAPGTAAGALGLDRDSGPGRTLHFGYIRSRCATSSFGRWPTRPRRSPICAPRRRPG